METQRPLPYNCNYSAFDYDRHNKAYTCYCEVIITKKGNIHYAHPSHQEFLINYLCKRKGITRKKLQDSIPRNRYGDFLEWLLEQTECVCVWYDRYIGNPNDMQQATLNKLQEKGCVDFTNEQ